MGVVYAKFKLIGQGIFKIVLYITDKLLLANFLEKMASNASVKQNQILQKVYFWQEISRNLYLQIFFQYKAIS